MTTDEQSTEQQDDTEFSEFQIFESQTEREQIMAQLKLHGIAFVTVEFSGSGDSGQIDFISASGHKRVENGAEVWPPIDCEKLMLSLPESVLIFSDNPEENEHATSASKTGWRVENGVGQVSVKEAAERIFWILDEHVGIDWSNNDGGRGEFSIDVDANTITCSYDQYETITNHVGDYKVL